MENDISKEHSENRRPSNEVGVIKLEEVLDKT